MDSIASGPTDPNPRPPEAADLDVDAACDELILRWRHGERPPAELFLQGRLGLNPNSDSAFDLIYAEFCVREEMGESPSLGEFSARFPQHAALLQRQMILHQTLGDVGEPANAWSTTLAEGFDTSRSAPAGYVIERELGRGGMGVVYQARQLRLNRVVALKMIRSGAHASPEDTARLLAEAEVIARFQHPNIVQIHAVGDCDGQPYFEMEYLGGGSLAAQLDGVPRPPRAASHLIETLARAIHQAHLRGIIHRDLKPANVLLSTDGIPKVADFGLARLLDADSGLTRTDSVLGSPGYMAPEQADGRARDAGPAADVYALGAMYYELLTGRPPFRAPTALETLDLVRHSDPVRPSQLQPGLPRDAETIALKCLDKDPHRRYTSAAALAEDLGRFARGEPILARPIGQVGRGVRWARRNRMVAGLAAAMVLILVGGFAGMAVLWVHATRQALAASQQRDEVGRLSAGLALDRGLELARSGHAAMGLHWMAETLKIPTADPALKAVARANLAAWMAEVPPSIAVAVQPAGPLHCGALSPDGRSYVAGGEDGSVTLWDLDSLRAVRIVGVHEPNVRDVAFSPDSATFATAGDDGAVRLWNARDASPIGAPMVQPEKVHGLAFHPSGKFLIATNDRNMRRWDLATHRIIGDPIDAGGEVVGKAFSPDGSLLVTCNLDAQLHRWDGQTGRLLGNPIHLPDAAHAVVFSPDSLRFAVGYGNTLSPDLKSGKAGVQIYESLTGKPIGPTMPHSAGWLSVRYSPDGRRLLVGDYQGTARVYDANGDAVGPSIRCLGSIVDLCISPDGQLGLVGSGGGAAVLVDLHDGRQLGAIVEGVGRVRVAFRPDGRTIVVVGDRTVRCLDVARVSAPSVVPRGQVRLAGFGPGGLRYTAGPDGSAWIWDAEGRPVGSPLVHLAQVTALAFHDGGRLIVTGSRDASVRIWGANGQPIGMPIAQPHWVGKLAISPDGRRLWVGCEANSSQLFDLATGRPIGPPAVHPGRFPGSGVRFVAITPDGKVAISVSNDGTIARTDTETGQPIGGLRQQYRPNELRMRDASLSPDGSTLMIVAGGTVHLSDAATGRDLLPEFGRAVTAGAFLPGDKFLVTGGEDRMARVWDIQSGRAIGAAMEHEQPIRSLAASPDGRYFLTLTIGGSVQLWDVASGKPIGPALRHDVSSAPPRFSPDGRTLSLTFGACEFRPVPQPDEFAESPTSLHLRTGLELDERGGFVPTLAAATREEDSDASEAAWHDHAAGLYEARREFQAALWHLDRLAVARPQDWWVHARRARVLRRSGHRAEAEAAETDARALASTAQTEEWAVRRAIVAQEDQRWADANVSWSEALTRWPDNYAMRAARGIDRARAGDWAGAAHDFRLHDRTRPALTSLLTCHALTFLMAGDTADYREACQAILRRRAAAASPRPLSVDAARIFALGPNATDDYASMLAAVSPEAHAEKPRPRDLVVYGALLYRAGKVPEAVEWLRRAQDTQVGGQPDGWIFLTMANHRLGQTREARRCYEQVRGGRGTSTGSFDDFLDDLTIRVLRREAEAAIYGPPLPRDVFAH